MKQKKIYTIGDIKYDDSHLISRVRLQEIEGKQEFEEYPKVLSYKEVNRHELIEMINQSHEIYDSHYLGKPIIKGKLFIENKYIKISKNSDEFDDNIVSLMLSRK